MDLAWQNHVKPLSVRKKEPLAQEVLILKMSDQHLQPVGINMDLTTVLQALNCPHHFMRSNWQPPWVEDQPPTTNLEISLQRLQEEDESTVYDWVRESQNWGKSWPSCGLVEFGEMDEFDHFGEMMQIVFFHEESWIIWVCTFHVLVLYIYIYINMSSYSLLEISRQRLLLTRAPALSQRLYTVCNWVFVYSDWSLVNRSRGWEMATMIFYNTPFNSCWLQCYQWSFLYEQKCIV